MLEHYSIDMKHRIIIKRYSLSKNFLTHKYLIKKIYNHRIEYLVS